MGCGWATLRCGKRIQPLPVTVLPRALRLGLRSKDGLPGGTTNVTRSKLLGERACCARACTPLDTNRRPHTMGNVTGGFFHERYCRRSMPQAGRPPPAVRRFARFPSLPVLLAACEALLCPSWPGPPSHALIQSKILANSAIKLNLNFRH